MRLDTTGAVPNLALHRLSVLVAAMAVAACHGSSTGPSQKIISPMSLAIDESQIAQGDTLQWTVTLPGPEASVVGDQLVLTFSGVGSGSASFAIPADIYGFDFTLVVPSGTKDGTLTLTATITAANQTAQASVEVKDTKPPLIDSAGLVGGPPLPNYINVPGTPGALLLGAGLTDTLQVWASDNHALAWVGWSLGAPLNTQDSAPVSGTAGGSAFPVAIPESLAASGAPVSLFARDADGNRRADTLGAALIISFNQYAVRSAPRQDTIPDLVIDTARGVVYIAQPDSERIAVLSLGTMTYQQPISLAGRPISLDLTTGGDSLLVALDSATSLTVVRLGAAPQVIDTIPVAPAPQDLAANLVSTVRVSADGYAVVTVRQPNSGSGTTNFQAEAVSLAKDTTYVPFYNLAPYTAAPPQATRSGDRTVLVIPGGGGLFYNVTANQWGEGEGATYSGPPFGYAVSNSATNVSLMGHWVDLGAGGGGVLGLDSLYGATIASNGVDAYTAESSCAPTDATCIDTAPGAFVRYKLGVWYPYNNLMFPSGARAVNVAMLPHAARFLIVSPDNKTLIGIGSQVIMAIDLTSSTPPSASVLARVRRTLTRSAKRLARSPLPSAVTNGAPSAAAWRLDPMLKVRAKGR